MKTKAFTAPTEATGFTQKLARTESEIAHLGALARRTQLQMETDQAELQALEAQAAAHNLQKQTAQQTINARRSALREAEAQAELAEGTLSEKPDLKTLERLLKQAQQEQMTILDKVGKAEQAEERRRQALQDACSQHQQTLTTLAERQGTMEAVRERVWGECGQEEYNSRLQKLNELQGSLLAKEQSVEQAKSAIDDFAREALQSLSPWPEHQSSLGYTLPYDNATTDVLEAALGLIDVLLTRGHDVENLDSQLLHQAGIRFGTLPSLLSWEERAINHVLYDTGMRPVALQQKQKDLVRLVEVYRANKREEVK